MSKLTELCVVDIETSALNENEGCIVEIGIILLNCETLEHFNLFNHLIKEPEKTLDCDAWIFNNSDLSYDLVERLGIQLEMLREELQTIFDTYYCTAFNQEFDFGWLRSRQFTIKHIAPDPMLLFADEVLKVPKFFDKKSGEYHYQKGSKFDVKTALSYYGIIATEPHRALGDATLEAKIIANMIARKEYPLEVFDNQDEIEKWMAKKYFHLQMINEIKNMKNGYEETKDMCSEITHIATIESFDHALADQQTALGFCRKHLKELGGK